MASSKVMMTSGSSKKTAKDEKKRTVEEVWKGIVSSGRETYFKTEPDDQSDSQLMTLEDFLQRAAQPSDPTPPTLPVKLEPLRLTTPCGGSGGSFGLGLSGDWSGEWSGGAEMIVGRGKRRGNTALAEQRHRRMIKNRESAARSRERKQAYQAELESLAVKLEEENEKLIKEKAAHTKERLNQLMERVVPVIEQRKPTRSLRRIHSMQW